MVYMAEYGAPQAKYVEASVAEKGMPYRNLTGTDTEWSSTLADQAWDLLAPKVGLCMCSLHTCSFFHGFEVEPEASFVLFGSSGGVSTMTAFAHLLLNKGVYGCWCVGFAGCWYGS